MSKLEALKELLKKVVGGQNSSTEIGGFASKIWRPKRSGTCEFMQLEDAYSGSLDAAKALHEAVLPGTPYWVEKKIDGELTAGIFVGSLGRTMQASGPNPARAWLVAILKALIAKEQEA